MDRARRWGERRTPFHEPNRTDRWYHEDNVTDMRYPLDNAADMRGIGGAALRARKQPGHSSFLGYHLHNFFAHAGSIRLKYRTYAHNRRRTDVSLQLEQLHEDIRQMVECVHDTAGATKARMRAVKGGFRGLKHPHPIYFHDDEYRAARHRFVRRFVRSLVRADEDEYRRFNNLPDPEIRHEDGGGGGGGLGNATNGNMPQ
jgi:hypothetical protein